MELVELVKFQVVHLYFLQLHLLVEDMDQNKVVQLYQEDLEAVLRVVMEQVDQVVQEIHHQLVRHKEIQEDLIVQVLLMQQEEEVDQELQELLQPLIQDQEEMEQQIQYQEVQ